MAHFATIATALSLSSSALQLISALDIFYKEIRSRKGHDDLAQDIRLFQSVLKESAALVQSLSRPPPPSAFLALQRCIDVEQDIQISFGTLIRVLERCARKRGKVLAIWYADHLRSTHLEVEKTLGRFKEAVLLLRDIASDSLTQELAQGVQINATDRAQVIFNADSSNYTGSVNVHDGATVGIEAQSDNHNAAEDDMQYSLWHQKVQRDPYLFNGSINVERAGKQHAWYPVRGMYDSGSIDVNFVRRELLERADFLGGIDNIEPTLVKGLGGPVRISESVDLRWTPDNDTRSYIITCFVDEEIDCDLLVCKEYFQKYDLVRRNRSIMRTALPMRHQYRTRAERAEEDQETERLDREATIEEEKRDQVERELRRTAAARAAAATSATAAPTSNGTSPASGSPYIATTP